MATPAGSFFQLTGQATLFADGDFPNIQNYGVSGTAIPNPQGYWLSLIGTGYYGSYGALGAPVTLIRIGIQLSQDPTKNSITFAEQSLNPTDSLRTLINGVAAITPCP